MQAGFVTKPNSARNTHSDRYRQMLQRLRQARIERHLTQEAVAAALGRPQSYVSKCESGERRIDPIELLDLADLYQKSLDELVR
jgi:transcriptional regulator with XRE-family HTH domain